MAYPPLIDLYGKCDIGIHHTWIVWICFPLFKMRLEREFSCSRCLVVRFGEGLRIFVITPRTDQVWHSSNHRIFVFRILAAQPFLVKKDVFLVILMFLMCFSQLSIHQPHPPKKKQGPYGSAFRPSHRHKYSCNQWLLSTHHNDTNGETSQN